MIQQTLRYVYFENAAVVSIPPSKTASSIGTEPRHYRDPLDHHLKGKHAYIAAFTQYRIPSSTFGCWSSQLSAPHEDPSNHSSVPAAPHPVKSKSVREVILRNLLERTSTSWSIPRSRILIMHSSSFEVPNSFSSVALLAPSSMPCAPCL